MNLGGLSGLVWSGLAQAGRLEILPPQGVAGWLLSVAVHTHPSHPRAKPASGTNINSTEARTYSVLVETYPAQIRGRGNNFGNTEHYKRTAVDSNPQRLRSALERFAIDVAAVPDLDYVDNQSIVFDGIDDSVGALPYPVAIAAG